MQANSTATLIQDATRLAEKQQLDQAYEIFRTIPLPLENKTETQYSFGRLCHLLQEKALAIDTFANLVLQHPDNPVFLAALGSAYLANQEHQMGLHFLKKALDINPRDLNTLINYGSHLCQLGQYQDGIKHLEAAQALKSRHSAIAHGLAIAYRALGEHDKAIQQAKNLIRADPESHAGYYELGHTYLEQGNTAEAIKAFQQAIKRNPTAVSAYYGIVESRKITPEDRPLIKEIEQCLQVAMPPNQKAYVHFALGKIYDDLKQPDAAFPHIQKANVLLKPAYPYLSPEGLFKQHRKLFTRERLQDGRYQGNSSRRPVFIVGMPRSGSTLVEQIVSSHPAVAGAGEMEELDRITRAVTPIGTQLKDFVPVWQNYLAEHGTAKLAEAYLESLNRISPNAERVVDKQLGNYVLIGMISLLFPNATIINTLRNPLDCGLSIYFKPFRDVRFAHDLQLIGQQYRLYRKIVAHWKSVLPPDRILDVQYEHLIEDPEGQTRRLINACGLPWDDRCLEFYKKQGTVSTSSLVQVRQPIYKTAKKRWQPYAPFLTDLAAELAPYLDEEEIEIFSRQGVPMKYHLLRHRLRSLAGIT